jgi:hypothetical protein
MLLYLLIGLGGGLIVSSWQGFKDPPWEGFSPAKFVRSPLLGAASGAAAFWIERSTGVLRVDNLGLLMLAALAAERLAGEIYKGFLRRGFHVEYVRLFERAGFPMHRGRVRAAIGVLFLAAGLTLYWWLGRLAGAVREAWGVSMATAAVVGGVIGTVVAIGGALKDSQLEGFKPKKFIRSPIMSVIGARAIVAASADPLLVALATIGFERVAVELYKTFLTRQVRGIHAGRPVLYPHWFTHRWMFAVSFLTCVAACAWLCLRDLR